MLRSTEKYRARFFQNPKIPFRLRPPRLEKFLKNYIYFGGGRQVKTLVSPFWLPPYFSYHNWCPK